MPISPSVREKIALTLGDLCGIGPEVTVKSLFRLKKNKEADFLVLGKAFFLNKLAKKLSLNIRFKDIFRLSEWPAGLSFVPCYFFEDLPNRVVYGRFDKRLGALAVRSIELAARLAMSGEVDCIVTAPINKSSVRKAGFDIPGHTEYLAELSKTGRYEMMLVGGNLRVVPVTRHLALKDVPKSISRRGVEAAILMADRELRRSFGIRKPKIVVCGLNPHAGEQGNFGREEIEVIAPAVKAARMKTDAKIIGPLSPDALFVRAYRGDYDAEVCMYHDQGLIPLKMISRGAGVNVTLGLPFVRTSPDHGTAYDIAGKWTADPGSMIEAIKLAVFISKNRKKFDRNQRA